MSEYWNRMAISFGMITNSIGCGKAIAAADWAIAALQGEAVIVLLVILHFANVAVSHPSNATAE